MPYYICNIHGRFLKHFNVTEYTFTHRKQDALTYRNKPKAFEQICTAYKAHPELRLTAEFHSHASEEPEQ